MLLLRYLLRVGLLLTLVSGCRLTPPNFLHPGHLYQQQLRATYHDPYAVTEGAPDFAGSRPPAYEQPRAPVVQSQWQLDMP